MTNLTPTALRREGEGLAIEWNDGARTFVGWKELRKACPCATCNEERQKPADPFKILSDRDILAGAPAPRQMVARGRYAYQIVWTDGHDTGIYPVELLRALSTKQ